MSNEKAEVFTLPEGRLINHSLFVKDAFNDAATPAYKLELALEDDDQIAALEDRVFDALIARFGDQVEQDEDVVIPLLDGDKLAKKRERRGKEGDAYKGKIVVRASTIYNGQGEDGPGGIQIFGPDARPIEVARKQEVYQGCYGIAGVTLGTYETADGAPGAKFYLAAFQKTRDGERLVSASDRSTLFKPLAGSSEGSAGSPRRRKARG